MPLVRALVIAVVAALAAAAPAGAATRYSAPGASGPEPCAAASPCAVHDAVGNAADGDSVVLRPGNYGSPAARLTTPIVANDRVDVAGESGQARPVLFLNATNAFQLDHSEATLRWVEIDNAGGGAALFMAARLADQVVVHSSAAGGTACAPLVGTIRNSVCRSTGSNAAAVEFSGGGLCGDAQPYPDSVLRGVTAWGGGPNSNAVSVRTNCSIQKKIVAVNSIMRGSARDVFTQTDANPNTRASVEADHSNFSTRTTDGLNASVADLSTQTAAPALVAPGAGDFRQLGSSPTIDGGVASDENGTQDVDGDTRAIRKPDIGADEYLVPPTVNTGGSGSVGIDVATVTGEVNPNALATTYHFEYGPTTAYGQSTEPESAGSGTSDVRVSANLRGLMPNTTYHYRIVGVNQKGTTHGADLTFTTHPAPPPPAPIVSELGLSPRTFAIGSKMPALVPAAKRKRAPVGTTIRFVLNQPGSAKLSFYRLEPGRRVGGSCRAQSRKNRSKPRCTRRVAMKRTLTVDGRAGLNQLRFQGRLTKRDRLGFGAHELVVVATDALGRTSAPVRAGFKIVRR